MQHRNAVNLDQHELYNETSLIIWQKPIHPYLRDNRWLCDRSPPKVSKLHKDKWTKCVSTEQVCAVKLFGTAGITSAFRLANTPTIAPAALEGFLDSYGQIPE